MDACTTPPGRACARTPGRVRSSPPGHADSVAGRLRRLGLVVVLAGTLATAGCTSSSSGQPGSGSTAAARGATVAPGADAGAVALQNAYQTVIRRVLPSVVEIRTNVGLGSGIVYDDKGDIVTNAHVVGDATTFQVYTSTSAGALSATLVGAYLPEDLAVIRVDNPKGLQPARFADSGKATVGDIVLAMGNPLGLASTVTNGIISAVGRTQSEPAEGGHPPATLPDMIQTSAAINPGNSGGALVNLDAEVVGIPTLAATTGQAGGAAPGIGFAIASNRVRRIADQFLQNGKVTNSGRAALGVRVTTLTDQSGQPLGVGVVDVTAGGAAAAAGIQAGDVITAVNKQPTPAAPVLSSVLADLSVGQQVPVTIERAGKEQQIQVTLGELAAS